MDEEGSFDFTIVKHDFGLIRWMLRADLGVLDLFGLFTDAQQKINPQLEDVLPSHKLFRDLLQAFVDVC
jgi:hypothetical protein